MAVVCPTPQLTWERIQQRRAQRASIDRLSSSAFVSLRLEGSEKRANSVRYLSRMSQKEIMPRADNADYSCAANLLAKRVQVLAANGHLIVKRSLDARTLHCIERVP